MAIDFSELQATPAHTGELDFSAIGGIPAVGQNEAEDETSALGAAGRGAVGMIPLGTQAYAATAGLAEGKPYTKEREELEKEIEADKANHPVARVAGQAAGLVAPALLTGGASAPESLAGAAGEGALVGAGFGTGNAIDTLTEGGSGAKAAGDIALGAGLGALGGAAGQKIAGALNKAVPGIETYAAKKAIQGVGMGSDELGNLSQQELIDTGKMLMDKGIVKPGASTQEMFDTAKALHENYGQTIGQIGNQARDLGLSTDTKPILQSLEEKFQAADALQNPDERKAALFYKRGMSDILAMSRQNVPDVLAKEGIITPSDITFDQLQRLKKSYGNSAFENGAVKNAAAADVYSALSSAQKSIIDNVKGNPNLPAQLKDAMTGYSKLYPVVDSLQDVLGRERAGNMPAKGFGMMGKMVGQLPGQKNPIINGLTALGLLGAGHPMWAVGAATASLQNPRVMSNAARTIAGAIPGITEKLPLAASEVAGAATSSAPKAVTHQNMGETVVHHAVGHAPLMAHEAMSKPATTVNTDHPALAPWRQVFQKNAATAKTAGEVQKSQAMTDFVLSQRDPAYAAAKQKAADEPVPEQQREQPENIGMAKGGVAVEPPPTSPEGRQTGDARKRFQPQFNTDMADKLKEFLRKRKEGDDAQPR